MPRLHLLGVAYATEAAKRWQSGKGGEMVIPEAMRWLQPLKEYAEGYTSVRVIWEEGPPKVSWLGFETVGIKA